MSGNGTLTERFGAVTISVEARDVVRMLARQALNEDEPIALPSGRALPRVGEFWEAEGGIYCGRLIGDDDRVYALVVARRAQGEFSGVTWNSATLKAAALDLEDFADWTLPNRMEALAIFQRLHPALKGSDDAFAEEVYWTSEQHASYSGSAWCQDFSDGYQGSYHKASSYRARAVRRVVID